MLTLIKNKAKEYWPYLAVVLAVILPWFFHSGYLFFTDMAWGPNIVLDWTSGGFLTSLLVKVLSFVLPVDFLQKIYLGIIVFVALVGGKKVVEFFIKDRLAVFTVSLFALFNPFVYDRFMYGQANIVMALGFLLLSSGYLFQYLESKSHKAAIYYGIFTALMLQFSVHFIFFGGVVFILFLVLYFKKLGTGEWKISLKHCRERIASVVVIIILLNINWLAAIPLNKSNAANFISSPDITSQNLEVFKTSGSSNAQVLGNVLMMSGFWGKDQHRYTDLTTASDNWGRSFLFLLPIIILGLIWGIRKRETRSLSIGLLIVFLVSVVLAAGVAISFAAPLSYWLFDHFPLYKGLRESQKWVSVIVLVYAIFLSMGTAALLKTKFVLNNRRILLIFLAAIIIMQALFLLWGFSGQVRLTPYPSDWQDINSSLVCANGDQTLFLPWHMYMGFSWIGNVVANPAINFFNCPIISGSDMEWGGIYDNSQSIQGKEVLQWMNSKGNDNTLLKDKKLSIKYIILAKEVDWQNYKWIGSSTDMTLLKDTNTLKVYKVNDQNTKNNK